jgi:hypothetical protein
MSPFPIAAELIFATALFYRLLEFLAPLKRTSSTALRTHLVRTRYLLTEIGLGYRLSEGTPFTRPPRSAL